MTIQKFIDEAREINSASPEMWKTFRRSLQMLEVLSEALEFYSSEKNLRFDQGNGSFCGEGDFLEFGTKAIEKLKQCEGIIENKD